MTFRIIVKERAEREFGELPQNLQQKFLEEFKRLAENPFLHPQVKKIQGISFGYRLRLGRWRILFALFPKEKIIEIVDIFFKKGKEDYFKRMKLF